MSSASFIEHLRYWSRGTEVAAADGEAPRSGAFSDPRAYVEEDGLPVFHLYVASSLPDDDGDRPARLIYRGQCFAIEAKYRGDTSLRFPKRSMTLDFDNGQTFDEPRLAGGFTGRRKVVLISPFNDNSYMRSRLAFELWNRMSPAHLQVKTYSAVVYVNGEYVGLYTAADHISDDFIAAHGLDKGGDLFKAVGGDANFSRKDADGLPKVKLRQGYEKKAGTPEEGEEAFRTIDALTAFVADSPPEVFQADRGVWMDTRDYEDWWIFATLAFTPDSIAKNAYHFRARGAVSRWRYIPWDLDASFGQDWDTRRLPPDIWDSFAAENLLFARMLEDPAIAGPLRERYRELLRGPLSREVVLGLIDAYSREVGPAARKDEAKWMDEYRTFKRWRARTDFTTFDEEVAFLRYWVDTRWSMLEQELP